ncbi:hypothetical protein JCM13304A_13010 [Desulfothermus okinawensis JCM 13304]
MKDKEIKKMAVQVTKEIIVKFIEIGRISPTNFDQFFAPIYREVLKTIGSPWETNDEDREK